MSAQKEEWRDIPGYGGWYQISTEGRVRSYRAPGNQLKFGKRLETPKALNPHLKKKNGRGDWLAVNLLGEDGKKHTEGMSKLMADTWMGGCPAGYLTCTKNRNPADVRLSNLHFMSTKEVAMRSLAMRGRGRNKKAYCKKLPVLKIDDTLTVVEAFPSARQAALAAKLPRCTILYYCNFKFKKSAFAPDGYIYSWDDSRRVWAMLKRAMRELDNKGIPYNSPFTGRYFDLPQDDDPNIDVDNLWWSQILTPARGGGNFRECGVMT